LEKLKTVKKGWIHNIFLLGGKRMKKDGQTTLQETFFMHFAGVFKYKYRKQGIFT